MDRNKYYLRVQGKVGRERLVPVSPTLARRLERYAQRIRRESPSSRLLLGLKRRATSGEFEALRESGVQQMIRGLAEELRHPQAGLPPPLPPQLHHLATPNRDQSDRALPHRRPREPDDDQPSLRQPDGGRRPRRADEVARCRAGEVALGPLEAKLDGPDALPPAARQIPWLSRARTRPRESRLTNVAPSAGLRVLRRGLHMLPKQTPWTFVARIALHEFTWSTCFAVHASSQHLLQRSGEDPEAMRRSSDRRSHG